MTEKKNSSSSDTLYMTDDLVGRLDPESLTEGPQLVPGGRVIRSSMTQAEIDKLDEAERIIKEAGIYDHTPPAPTGIPTTVEFDLGGGDKLDFDCTLQLVSFGKDGWRVNVDGVAPKTCVELAKLVAERSYAWISGVRVHGIGILKKDVDVTIHFGGLGDTCSVSIAADSADAI